MDDSRGGAEKDADGGEHENIVIQERSSIADEKIANGTAS